MDKILLMISLKNHFNDIKAYSIRFQNDSDFIKKRERNEDIKKNSYDNFYYNFIARFALNVIANRGTHHVCGFYVDFFEYNFIVLFS